MSWSQNFCLCCDNANNTANPYCSERCRLEDMNRASTRSTSHSPLHSHSFPYSSASSSAWGFADSKRNSIVSIQSSASSTTPSGSSYSTSPGTASLFSPAHAPSRSSGAAHHHHHHHQSAHSLASSSSRSSLSSAGAYSHPLSDQAVAQLRDYVNSFDQSRDYKRRGTLP